MKLNSPKNLFSTDLFCSGVNDEKVKMIRDRLKKFNEMAASIENVLDAGDQHSICGYRSISSFSNN